MKIKKAERQTKTKGRDVEFPPGFQFFVDLSKESISKQTNKPNK